jgi:hypothetical protein
MRLLGAWEKKGERCWGNPKDIQIVKQHALKITRRLLLELKIFV